MFNHFTDQHRDSTGLDMSMSKKIIDDHVGEIRMVSEMGARTPVVIEPPIEAAWLTEMVLKL